MMSQRTFEKILNSFSIGSEIFHDILKQGGGKHSIFNLIQNPDAKLQKNRSTMGTALSDIRRSGNFPVPES